MTRLVTIRTLILDDDEAVCRQLAEALAAHGYDVVTFIDAAAAAVHLERAAAHVAFVDLHLGDDGPASILNRLRAAAPYTRIIGLAAFPDVGRLLAAMRSGAADVLEKPIHAQALLAAVERQTSELGLIVRSEADLLARIGERVRVFRARSGRTQAEVAQDAGISAAQLSQIESGKSATTLWTLARLCQALHCSLRDLFAAL